MRKLFGCQPITEYDCQPDCMLSCTVVSFECPCISKSNVRTISVSERLLPTEVSSPSPILSVITESMKSLHSFINTGGRSNCSSNGLSSISRLSPSGAKAKMPSVSKFMSLSSRSVSLVSLNMIIKSTVRLLRPCAFLDTPYLSKMTSTNFSNIPSWRMKKTMIGNFYFDF